MHVQSQDAWAMETLTPLVLVTRPGRTWGEPQESRSRTRARRSMPYVSACLSGELLQELEMADAGTLKARLLPLEGASQEQLESKRLTSRCWTRGSAGREAGRGSTRLACGYRVPAPMMTV
jgi:hypothetical protein